MAIRLCRFQRLALPLLGVFLGLAALEGILRLAAPTPPFDARLSLRPRERKVLHPRLRGIAGTANYTTTSIGLRGSEAPPHREGSFGVIAVGGSTTQCYYLDDRKTWPALLEQRLQASVPGAWVGNGGIDGNSTRGHVVFMDTVVRAVKPDLVLVLAGVNDLAYSFESEAGTQAVYERWKFSRWVFARSRLLQQLYQRKKILFDEATVVDDAGHGDFVPEPLGEEAPLPGPLAAHLPSLGEFRLNLERLDELARGIGCRLVLLTQPLLFGDEPRWRAVSGKLYWVRGTGRRVSAATLWRMLEEFNAVTRAVAAERRLQCIDLAREVPHAEEYFYDPAHFTEAGAALVADRVAGALFAGGAVPATGAAKSGSSAVR